MIMEKATYSGNVCIKNQYGYFYGRIPRNGKTFRRAHQPTKHPYLFIHFSIPALRSLFTKHKQNFIGYIFILAVKYTVHLSKLNLCCISWANLSWIFRFRLCLDKGRNLLKRLNCWFPWMLPFAAPQAAKFIGVSGKRGNKTISRRR